MVTQRPTPDNLGARVDALRSDRGVSAQQLALATQIPYATLLRRLAGDDLITVTELKRISKALGVTPASWFEAAA